MNYFVTGATGFIGKFLLERLLAREEAEIHVLVRDSSREKFEAMAQRYGVVDAIAAQSFQGGVEPVE